MISVYHNIHFNNLCLLQYVWVFLVFGVFFSVTAVLVNEQKLNTSCWNKACAFAYNRPGENRWVRDFL